MFPYFSTMKIFNITPPPASTTGKIVVDGYIGCFELEGRPIAGVELIDVISQVKAQPQATFFNVIVRTKGGLVNVGTDIAEYLKTMGVPFCTIIQDYCMSIGTRISLSAPKGLRYALPVSQMMIHNPWTETAGDAAKHISVAEEMQTEEDALANEYAEATGITKEGVLSMMRTETSMDENKMLSLGFVDQIIQATPETSIQSKNIIAVLKSNDMKNTATNKPATPQTPAAKPDAQGTLVELLNLVKNLLIKAPATPDKKKIVVAVYKNVITTDATGEPIQITNADGTDIAGSPAKGQSVMIDETPADGIFILPDYNVTITCAAGIITDVQDMSTPGAPPAAPDATAQARIKELETELVAEKAKNIDIDTKIKQLEVGLKAVASKANPGSSDAIINTGKDKEDDDSDNRIIAAQKRKEVYKKQGTIIKA